MVWTVISALSSLFFACRLGPVISGKTARNVAPNDLFWPALDRAEYPCCGKKLTSSVWW